MRHSEGFKARMVRRMAGPEGISANALSQEVGVGQPTLSRWLRKAGSLSLMTSAQDDSKKPRKGPQQWTAEEKLRAVVEAASMSEEDLGSFLRGKGLHAADLEAWRQAALTVLGGPTKRRSRKATPEAKKIRALEKDLHRKDKALAEVTALLALKKKLEMLWGDEDDGTSTRKGT